MDIAKLKEKIRRTDPVIRRAREIERWYQEHASISGQKKLVIDKLRNEYERKQGELEKKQNEERDALVLKHQEAVKAFQQAQKEAQELGVKHMQESKDLSRKYVEMELRILNDKI